jgi:hypothetical protein
MLGCEKAYGNAAIQALLNADRNLMEATVEDALRISPRYGKPDTLGLDAIPEISIATQVEAYDQHAILVTEERNDWPGYSTSVPTDPLSFRTFYVSDPTDRSADFAKFLEGVADKKMRVLDVVNAADAKERWESKSSSPVSVAGPYSAITCIRRGVPVLTVLANYLTQELFLACTAGVFVAPIDYQKTPLESITIESVCATGRRIEFGARPDSYQKLKKFVTFLGAEGKAGYLENFKDSKLMEPEDLEKNIFYRQPGGPSRILYLSKLLAPGQDVGFILANGEKITEWIHWFPFIRFARSANDSGEPILHAYEVWHPRPHTKEGILMSTSPNYSVFRETPDGNMVIDVSVFQRFNNPSKIRSTLLVCLNSNDWAQQVVQRHGYRRIKFS